MFQRSFHILGNYTMIMQILPGFPSGQESVPRIARTLLRPSKSIGKKFRSHAETSRREQRSRTSKTMRFQGQPRKISWRFYYIDNMHRVNEPNSDPFETWLRISRPRFATSCQLQMTDQVFGSHRNAVERNWLLWGCQGPPTPWIFWTADIAPTVVFDNGTYI